MPAVEVVNSLNGETSMRPKSALYVQLSNVLCYRTIESCHLAAKNTLYSHIK